MKISDNFFLQEFVPRKVFDQYGASATWFVSPWMISYAEFLRARFKKAVIINNWKDGGILENRGFRLPDEEVGGFLSQHKFKSALDTNIAGLTPEELDDDIKNNFSAYQAAGLSTIEDIAFTTGKIVGDFSGWNHGDCRSWGDNLLHIVKP